MFRAQEQERVRTVLLEQCGNNLPLLAKCSSTDMDRFRFAVLKLSGGSLIGLDEAIRLAKEDWRDLLIAAEFSKDVKAHESWLPK
jgi:hypothetical protein